MLLFYLFFQIGILHYTNLTLVSIHSLARKHSVPNDKLRGSVQSVGWLALTQYIEGNPSPIESSEQKQALLEHPSDGVNDFCIATLGSKHGYDKNDMVLDAHNHIL